MTSQDQIKDLRGRVDALEKYLDIPGKRAEIAEKEQQTQAAGFWDNPKAAELFLKGISSVKSWVIAYDKACSAVDDLDVLYDFAVEAAQDDPEKADGLAEVVELDAAYKAALSEVESLELRNMLGGEGDNLGAVLTINSGAGGTEANDWSAMLMRMYLRWGERNGYKMTITELQEGDEAGIKSTTIEVEGDYAYGYL